MPTTMVLTAQSSSISCRRFRAAKAPCRSRANMDTFRSPCIGERSLTKSQAVNGGPGQRDSCANELYVCRASRLLTSPSKTACRRRISPSSCEISACATDTVSYIIWSCQWDGKATWFPSSRSGTGVVGSSISLAAVCPHFAHRDKDMVSTR